jgi:hypothetical protein
MEMSPSKVCLWQENPVSRPRMEHHTTSCLDAPSTIPISTRLYVNAVLEKLPRQVSSPLPLSLSPLSLLNHYPVLRSVMVSSGTGCIV